MEHDPESGAMDSCHFVVAPDEGAAPPTFDAIYAQLRRLARGQLGTAPRTTLCTTALVHEAWLKLGADNIEGMPRPAFLALAAKVMRHVLIDHVRERCAAKRGAGLRPLTLDADAISVAGNDGTDLLTIEHGLKMLEALDPRLVSVVECHFFAGMDFAEIGGALQLSERTVQRDWRRARAFLQTRLADAGP